jgi:hypothetical protein
MADGYDTIDESRLVPSAGDSRQIRIIHPGYSSSGGDDEFNVLISFEAFDDGGTGIDYDTAHTACAILANNAWDGYFSEDVDGKKKASPPDGILRHDRYYFCLPSSISPSTDQYPIVPRFKDWRFPHQILPSIWTRLRDQKRLDQKRESQSGHGRCLFSNCGDVVEQAHLIPSQQSSWWTENLMKR